MRKVIYYILYPLAVLADDVYCVIRCSLFGNHPLNPSFILRALIRPGYGKLEFWYWRLLDYAYTWIRFIRRWPYDFDINEGFHCAICGKPFLRRWLDCGDPKCVAEGIRLEYW